MRPGQARTIGTARRYGSLVRIVPLHRLTHTLPGNESSRPDAVEPVRPGGAGHSLLLLVTQQAWFSLGLALLGLPMRHSGLLTFTVAGWAVTRWRAPPPWLVVAVAAAPSTTEASRRPA